MALSTIRKFTEEDSNRLNASAVRFVNRHGIMLNADCDFSKWEALEYILWTEFGNNRSNGLYISRLWQACKCRALNVNVSASVTVAYGYIGYSVK